MMRLGLGRAGPPVPAAAATAAAGTGSGTAFKARWEDGEREREERGRWEREERFAGKSVRDAGTRGALPASSDAPPAVPPPTVVPAFGRGRPTEAAGRFGRGRGGALSGFSSAAGADVPSGVPGAASAAALAGGVGGGAAGGGGSGSSAFAESSRADRWRPAVCPGGGEGRPPRAMHHLQQDPAVRPLWGTSASTPAFMTGAGRGRGAPLPAVDSSSAAPGPIPQAPWLSALAGGGAALCPCSPPER